MRGMRLTIAATCMLALVAGPVAAEDASQDDTAPHIEDPAGDANGLNGQGLVPDAGPVPTSPASHAPADIRAVRYDTPYVAIKVGDDGIDHQPTGIRIHFTTEAVPAAQGPTLQYRVEAVIGGCSSYLQAHLQGPAPGPFDPPAGSVEWVQRDATCPNGATRVTHPAWTATVIPQERSIVMHLPYSALTPAQLQRLAEGAPVSASVASTRIVTGHPLGRLEAPQIDVTEPGRLFIVGEDMPPDVPCTKNCP